MFLDKVLLFQTMFFWCLPGLSLFGALNGKNDRKQHKFSFCCDQRSDTNLRRKENGLLVSRDKFTIVKKLSLSYHHVSIARNTVSLFQAQLWELCLVILGMLFSLLSRHMR